LPTSQGGVVLIESLSSSSSSPPRISVFDECGAIRAQQVLAIEHSVVTGNACIGPHDRILLAGAAQTDERGSRVWVALLNARAEALYLREWPSRYAEIVSMAWSEDGPYVLTGGHQVVIGGRTFVDDLAPKGYVSAPGPLWLVGLNGSGESRFVEHVGRGEGGYLLTSGATILAFTQNGGDRTTTRWSSDGGLIERQALPGVFRTPVWYDTELLVRILSEHRTTASGGECSVPPSAATLLAVDRGGRLLESVFDDTPARRRTKVRVREADGKVSSERVMGGDGGGPLAWGQDGSAFAVSFVSSRGVVEVTKWRPRH